MSRLYSHSIGTQLYNTKVVFKMRDSVPSVRCSSVCNVFVYGESRLSLLIVSTDYNFDNYLFVIYYYNYNMFNFSSW